MKHKTSICGSLVQETPDSKRPDKGVFPLLACEPSIIQPPLNVGQGEVRRDCPPLPRTMMLTLQKADDYHNNDGYNDNNNDDDDLVDEHELISPQTFGSTPDDSRLYRGWAVLFSGTSVLP